MKCIIYVNISLKQEFYWFVSYDAMKPLKKLFFPLRLCHLNLPIKEIRIHSFGLNIISKPGCKMKYSPVSSGVPRCQPKMSNGRYKFIVFFSSNLSSQTNAWNITKIFDEIRRALKKHCILFLFNLILSTRLMHLTLLLAHHQNEVNFFPRADTAVWKIHRRHLIQRI